MSFSLIITAIEEGLAYGLLALGVFLTFRILDFPDLTVEGSFPLGAAVLGRLLVLNFNPLLATAVAFFAGGIAGIMTGILNTKLKITGLLAGILTMTSFYTINLRLMGSPNIGLYNQSTLITLIGDWLKTNYISLITFGVFVLIIKFLIDYFLFTDLGLAIRATGDNPVMIESLGVNTDNIKILGLFIANGLAGLSGALVAQYNGFSDIGMGSGMIITGLASVIIGEVIIRTRRIPLATLGVIVGSIIYRLARAITYELDFVEPTDLKLVSVIIIIIALGAPTLRKFMIQDEFAENLLEEGGTDA